MLPGIAAQLEAIRLRLEGHDACENCGCELAEADIVEGEDGELLCEECADEMYEGIEWRDTPASRKAEQDKYTEVERKVLGAVYHGGVGWDDMETDAEKKAAIRFIKNRIMNPPYAKGMPYSLTNAGADSYDRMYESTVDECACQDEVTEADLQEKAMSKFKKLVGALKRKGATSPEGLAAWIGAKKMGKGNVAKGRKMLQKMAVKARGTQAFVKHALSQ